MKHRDKIAPFVFVAVCLVFIALRFNDLTASCLWFDEIFTVHAAEMDFKNLFWFVAQDLIHPPLAYVLLEFWVAAGGESLFWLRFYPVFFAILSLYPLARFCRTLKLDYATIATAALFLAVNGCLIKYAQEVRMYSLFQFLALTSMWLFARYFYLGKNIWILTALNVLLIYTHYFGWLVVLAEIAAIVFLQRIKIRETLAMLGILLASFAPWIAAVWRAAQTNADLGQNIGWIARPDAAVVFQFVLDLVEPFYFQQSSVEPASLLLISLPLVLLIATASVIYLIDLKSEPKEERQVLVLLAIFAFLPVILAFAASWILPYSVWGTRHLIVVFAPFAILCAIALTRIKVAPLAGIFLALVLTIFGVAFYLETQRPAPRYIWCAWENLAAGLDKTQRTKIYAFEDVVAYDLWFALRDAAPNFEIVKIDGVEGIAEDKAYFLPRGFDGVGRADENGITGERFFVAFRDSNFNEKHPPLKNLREKGYRIGEPQVFETPGLNGYLVEVRK